MSFTANDSHRGDQLLCLLWLAYALLPCRFASALRQSVHTNTNFSGTSGNTGHTDILMLHLSSPPSDSSKFPNIPPSDFVSSICVRRRDEVLLKNSYAFHPLLLSTAIQEVFGRSKARSIIHERGVCVIAHEKDLHCKAMHVSPLVLS